MPKPVILCVDDETLVLDSLKIELRKSFGNKYLYEFANDGAEGMEIITDILTAEPATKMVVISDWWMPEMKGDEFLINVNRQYPQITTIMLTGQASEAAIADVQARANLYRCIRKPWAYQDLMTSIESALLQQKI
ncbi:MAG TPA: response regulator [Xenococcaceae cyanobacterium]